MISPDVWLRSLRWLKRYFACFDRRGLSLLSRAERAIRRCARAERPRTRALRRSAAALLRHAFDPAGAVQTQWRRLTFLTRHTSRFPRYVKVVERHNPELARGRSVGRDWNPVWGDRYTKVWGPDRLRSRAQPCERFRYWLPRTRAASARPTIKSWLEGSVVRKAEYIWDMPRSCRRSGMWREFAFFHFVLKRKIREFKENVATIRSPRSTPRQREGAQTCMDQQGVIINNLLPNVLVELTAQHSRHVAGYASALMRIAWWGVAKGARRFRPRPPKPAAAFSEEETRAFDPGDERIVRPPPYVEGPRILGYSSSSETPPAREPKPPARKPKPPAREPPEVISIDCDDEGPKAVDVKPKVVVVKPKVVKPKVVVVKPKVVKPKVVFAKPKVVEDPGKPKVVAVKPKAVFAKPKVVQVPGKPPK